jgi:hypothetical protein
MNTGKKWMRSSITSDPSSPAPRNVMVRCPLPWPMDFTEVV